MRPSAIDGSGACAWRMGATASMSTRKMKGAPDETFSNRWIWCVCLAHGCHCKYEHQEDEGSTR